MNQYFFDETMVVYEPMFLYTYFCVHVDSSRKCGSSALRRCNMTYRGRGADLQIVFTIMLDKFQHYFHDVNDVDNKLCRDDQDNEDEEGAEDDENE